MTLTKRPNRVTTSTSINTGNSPDKVKKFNNTIRYVQGQRVTLAPSGSVDFEINLTAGGKALLGIAVITADDIKDCQITLSVNNNNVLSQAALSNLDPNYVGNMMFFPIPQPLTGKDTLKGTILKNDAGAGTVLLNTFYVSALK